MRNKLNKRGKLQCICVICCMVIAFFVSETNVNAAINLQASSQVVITKQPESVNAATGKQFILKVEAEGTNLKYKWQAQKTESGEWTDFRDTTQSLTRTMSSIYDGWKIRCIVTDGNGNNVTSNVATVKLVSGPSITKQPQSVNAANGRQFTLKVEAEGTGLKYKWQAQKPGESSWSDFNDTTASLTRTMSSTYNGWKIRCIVTDGNGNNVTSNVATVKLVSGPSITKQPQSVNAANGRQFTLKVEAEGTGLKYKWQAQKPGESSWSDFNDTTASLIRTMSSTYNGWKIRCIVTDGNGNNVTSNVATVKLVSGPSITKQPQSVNAANGRQFTLKVEAEGTGLKYKWQAQKPGESSWSDFNDTTASLIRTMSSTYNGWKIRCIVTDGNGNNVTSNVATVKLVSGPSIIKQPQSVNAANGRLFTLKVEAEGTGLKYKWQAQKPGESSWSDFNDTTASLTRTMSSTYNGWKIRCIVTDGNGNNVTSNVVTVKLVSGPSITKQPKSVNAANGRLFTLKVEAEGTGLKYKWQAQKPGESSWSDFNDTTASLTRTMSSTYNGWKIRCIVTDGNGNNVTSNVVTVKLVSGPSITKQPQSVNAANGRQFTLKVEAEGTGLKYKWQAQKPGESSWADFSDTTASLTRTMSSTYNGWKIRCIVTDGNGNNVISDVITVIMINNEDWELPIM